MISNGLPGCAGEPASLAEIQGTTSTGEEP